MHHVLLDERASGPLISALTHTNRISCDTIWSAKYSPGAKACKRLPQKQTHHTDTIEKHGQFVATTKRISHVCHNFLTELHGQYFTAPTCKSVSVGGRVPHPENL